MLRSMAEKKKEKVDRSSSVIFVFTRSLIVFLERECAAHRVDV